MGFRAGACRGRACRSLLLHRRSRSRSSGTETTRTPWTKTVAWFPGNAPGTSSRCSCREAASLPTWNQCETRNPRHRRGWRLAGHCFVPPLLPRAPGCRHAPPGVARRASWPLQDEALPWGHSQVSAFPNAATVSQRRPLLPAGSPAAFSDAPFSWLCSAPAVRPSDR